MGAGENKTQRNASLNPLLQELVEHPGKHLTSSHGCEKARLFWPRSENPQEENGKDEQTTAPVKEGAQPIMQACTNMENSVVTLKSTLEGVTAKWRLWNREPAQDAEAIDKEWKTSAKSVDMVDSVDPVKNDNSSKGKSSPNFKWNT